MRCKELFTFGYVSFISILGRLYLETLTMWYSRFGAEKHNDNMSAERLSTFILSASFAVWVVYGTLQGMGHWPAGVLFGLLASISLLAFETSRHIQVKLMDWVLLGYFALATLATFVIRLAEFPVYSSVVVWVLYAGVTWISVLVGAPFALQYARQSAPPEHWNSPGFLRTCRVVSMVWGAGFLVNLALVVLSLYPHYHSMLVAVIAPILVMASCAVFTSRYAKISRARAQNATVG